jgi:hypothetical protein
MYRLSVGDVERGWDGVCVCVVTDKEEEKKKASMAHLCHLQALGV